MNIQIYIEPISNVQDLVEELLKVHFGLNEVISRNLFSGMIKKHFTELKESMYLVVETDYVDKVYRDSYYHYYSSKSLVYQKNCIRISLFEGEVSAADFRDAAGQLKLQERYRGFLVLRPNAPYLIGRSIISPNALKSTGFLACSSTYDNTVNAVKLKVEAFPHSSQDTETISCAETTIWAIMEYFSHRYPEYKPTLPSKIIKTLNRVTSERQVPSKGLNIQQMSFALREYGFGTRIYSSQHYKHEFDRLISCYVESGIPIIIAIENDDLGHALLCIGHELITDKMVEELKPHDYRSLELRNVAATKKITVYDYDSIKKQFLFIDDNLPAYKLALLDDPAAHYSTSKWKNCTITHFIVPLYPKIYLEAFEAKNFIARFLLSKTLAIAEGSELVQRTYLASSRSFKDKLAINPTFSPDLRDLILEMSMPKFIWVAELSNKELIKTKKANGLIILDATEANLFNLKPLIIAAYQGKVINFEQHSGKLENNNLTLNDFSIFENNLKPF